MSSSTIRDVAEIAGVSLATVSRAMNSPKHLSPETLKRVTAAIHSVGYRPNFVARSLKSRKSRLVGLIVSDILNPFFVGIVKSAERLLTQEGYTAIICDSEENSGRELHYLNDLASRRIDGLLMIPALEHNVLPRTLKHLNIPTVFVDRYLSGEYDCIKTDNAAGISLLVSHLVANGYRSIAFISGPVGTLPGRERSEAFRRELQLHGLPIREERMQFCDFSVAGGYAATEKILRLQEIPEAIVASNNLTGIGALKAIAMAGLQIPRDIGLVVFDDFLMSDLTNPPLTVVTQPAELIGEEAARLLVRLLKEGRSGAPELIMHTPKLVVRRSTKLLGTPPP